MIYNLTDLHSKNQNYNTICNDINDNLLYAIAWDGEHDTKKYYSFKDYVDFESIIKRINRKKNNEHEVKQRIYYEIIGKKCKAYFDIDIKDDNVKITNYDFDLFVKDIFIPYFNAFMKSNICYDDLLIYTRKHSIVYISSIHIIVKNYQIHKTEIKEFLKYLAFMNDSHIITHFDTKIYTKNRLFNLPYNTKLKHFLKDPNNPYYFLDFKQQDDKPSEYLVSYRYGLRQIETKKQNGSFKLFQLLSKSLMKKAFDKLKSWERQMYKCCNDIKLDGYDEDGMYCLSCGYNYKRFYFADFNKKQEDDKLKQMKKQEPKKQIFFNNPSETFDFVVLNMPNNFFNHSADWKLLTCLFKKFNIQNKQFNMWNELSIEKTTNHSWSIEKNISFYNSIDTTQVKSGIPTLKKLLEKYITDYEVVFENKKIELFEWLERNTNIDQKAIREVLYDKNITKGVYGLNELFEYNEMNGFLFKTTNDKKIVVGNFYHEVEFKKIFETQKIKNIVEYDKIEDTFELVDTFIANSNKVFCLKAKWGSGKSHFIIKRMIYQFQNTNNRVVFLTENNALNKQIEQSFSTDTFKIVSHIDTSKKELQETTNNIVCSCESIQKIIFKETDILILDEFESILNHFESDTFDNKHLERFKQLKYALQTCKKVILLDADISQPRINLMENIIGNKETITTLQANTNNFNNYKFNVFLDKIVFFNKLEYEIKATDNKICVASSVRSQIDKLYNHYLVKYPNKKILKLDGNGVFINIADAILDKREVLKNLEETILNYQIDIFLYSPTIKTGVSINTEYFDKCYAYGSSSSLCVREFIQMLFRARNLKQKEMNIGFFSDFSKPNPYVSTDRISYVLLAEPSITLYMLYRLTDKEDTDKKIGDYKETFNYDTDFFKLKTINEFENYHSKKSYTQEFCIRMLYNHNIQLNYINDTEEDIEIKNEEQTETATENTETTDKMVNAELLTRKEYMELVFNDQFRKLNYWKRTKAEFFYKTFFINGISNQDIYDIDIYNRVNKEDFYKKYSTELKTEYKSINAIINNSVENLIYSYTNKQNTNEQNYNAELEFNHADDCKLVFIKKTIDYLQINLLQMPFIITNAELESRLWNNTDYRQLLNDFVDSSVIDLNAHKKQYNTEQKKGFISYIKHLLDNVNLSIKYVDKNTTRPYDKMIINYKDFVLKREYLGRLTDRDLKLTETQIKKFKRAFQYKLNETETITAHKQVVKRYNNTDNIYFTTYTINQKKIKMRINGYTIKDADTNNKLFKEIISVKVKPYIKENLEEMYADIYKKYITQRDQEAEEEY